MILLEEFSEGGILKEPLIAGLALLTLGSPGLGAARDGGVGRIPLAPAATGVTEGEGEEGEGEGQASRGEGEGNSREEFVLGRFATAAAVLGEVD